MVKNTCKTSEGKYWDKPDSYSFKDNEEESYAIYSELKNGLRLQKIYGLSLEKIGMIVIVLFLY